MAQDPTLDDYFGMSKEEAEKRKTALEAFKLQQEVIQSPKEKRRTKIAANLGIITVAVGIVGGILGLVFSAQTTANQVEESRFKARVEDQTEFNSLLKDATNCANPASQRVPLIFSLQKYWRVEYELPVANALASMIANEDDQAIMEACAETIGNAYDENTPKDTQVRLRELLYGTLGGKIGVVMRIENLIYDRHKGTFSRLDDSHPDNERDWTKDPHYNLRIFYIGESVRKNWENLQEANFEKDSLPFILLYAAHAEGANFSGTDMRGGRIFGTHFDNAKMNNVNLRGADLSGADFKFAGLESAFFGPPDPQDIPREPKLIDGTRLDHTKLTGAHFVGATLNKADFTNADLTGADLRGADLSGADFKFAGLESAFFGPPDPKDIPKEPKLIDGTQLNHTKLTGAHFVGATLNKADFTSADLTGADLTDAHLVDTVMTDAILDGTIVREDELRKTKGQHKGTPKFIK
jgi:uncharacterized protein YjbI with pentapeptide repeats